MTQNKKAVTLAILAAALYAVNIPLSKMLLVEVDPAMMASLLYLGAGIGLFLVGKVQDAQTGGGNGNRLTRKEMPYTVAMVILDILAPILLMLGIMRTTSASVSLLNNFEIVATSVVALVIFKESISSKLWGAILLVTIASIILTFEGGGNIEFNEGSLLVLGAALCWGFENNCTKMLSHKSTTQIVTIKGIFSGLGSFIVALILNETIPGFAWILIVLLLGFISYGLSINFYIMAQRDLGAAKTSAFYSIAPFLGVAFSMLLVGERPGLQFYVALVVMAFATWLLIRDSVEGTEEEEIPPYYQGNFPFWDDSHISESMLKAHLNPDTDTASRKPETIDKTVNWILSQHPTAQTLLDLGCGPGLYTKRFYEEELEVTGIDMSERSIAYAQRQEANIDYEVGNYVEMNFQNEFDIITLIYYDFGVLKPEDRRRLLQAVKRALRPDGIFVFDVLHVNSLKDFEQEKREIDMGDFFTTEPHTLTLASIYYPDTKNTLDHYIVQTEDENREYFIWNQLDWALLDACWQEDKREFQYFACDYLKKHQKKLTFEDLPRLVPYLKEKQWWDTIDSLDTVVGNINFPDKRMNETMLDWSQDPDFWIRRVAINHQRGRKKNTNTTLLDQILVNNLGSDEFFINKAIGWALREYSKTDPEWVKSFIEHNKESMANLSIREGSKYI